MNPTRSKIFFLLLFSLIQSLQIGCAHQIKRPIEHVDVIALPLHTHRPEQVDAMVWSPDGRRLAVALPGRVVVFDTATGKVDAAFEHEMVACWRLKFSDDGRRLFAETWLGLFDGTVKLFVWDCSRDKGTENVKVPPVNSLSVLSGDMDDNGRKLFVVEMDQTLQMIEIATGRRTKMSLPDRIEPVHGVRLSPKHQYLSVLTSDGLHATIWILSADGSRIVQQRAFDNNESIAFSPAGHLVLSRDRGGFKLLDEHGKSVPTGIDLSHISYDKTALSPDGKLIAMLGETIEILDLANGTWLRSIELETQPWDQRHVCFSPDSQTLAITQGRTIRLERCRDSLDIE